MCENTTSPMEEEARRLRQRSEKLKTEIAMQIIRRDDMIKSRKALERDYLISLGALENEMFEVEISLKRQKRRFSLIVNENRRDLDSVDRLLDEEFLPMEEKLERNVRACEQACYLGPAETLDSYQKLTLKNKYRRIARETYSGIADVATAYHRFLFEQARQAFFSDDLYTMSELYDQFVNTVDGGELVDPEIYRERIPRYRSLLRGLSDEIRQIEDGYPFSTEQLLNDPESLESYQDELRDGIGRYNESIAYLRGAIARALHEKR